MAGAVERLFRSAVLRLTALCLVGYFPRPTEGILAQCSERRAISWFYPHCSSP